MNKEELTQHQKTVQAFLEQCEHDDPENFKKVCDAYPVITAKRWKVIQQREYTNGLRGELRSQGEE